MLRVGSFPSVPTTPWSLPGPSVWQQEGRETPRGGPLAMEGWDRLCPESRNRCNLAVGNGFHDVVVEDVGAGFEVGDGAGDFEDAVVGAGGHV